MSPGDDTEKLVRGSAACGVLLLVCAGIQLWMISQDKGAFARAEAWTSPQAWHVADCKVISTGVSCVEEGTGSTCGGFGANGSSHHTVDGSSVFNYKDIAVCPGTYWCATEGGQCTCHGEVGYATELFNGYDYTAIDPEFRWNASGSFTCGTDKDGEPFKRDPAPFAKKHCWCTPRAILEKLGRIGGAAAVREKRDVCAKEANSDYMAKRSVPPQTEASLSVQQRRLAGKAGGHDGGDHRSQAADMDDLDFDDSEHTGDDIGQPGAQPQAQPRHLTSSPRRRRTFSYTPWALVEVPQESGADDDDDDLWGPSSSGESDGKKRSAFACAYDFGAPEASYKDFESDGTWGWFGGDPGAAGDAQALTDKWAVGTTTACLVRRPGRSGADTCAVAMEPLSELGDRRESQLSTARVLTGVFSAAAVLCLGAAACLYYQAQQEADYSQVSEQ